MTANLPAMALEAAETSAAIRRQIERCAPLFKLFAAKMAEVKPSFVTTQMMWRTPRPLLARAFTSWTANPA